MPFLDRVESGFTRLSEKANSVLSGGFSIWILLFAIAVVIVCFGVWLGFRDRFETPTNIRNAVGKRIAAEEIKVIQGTQANRKGLYIQRLSQILNC